MDEERFHPIDETDDRQHVNPDGETDAQKGARMGGIGGAITGGIAGSAIGPAGTLAGAVIGGVVGAVASGAAVSAVDTFDGDSTTDHPQAVVDNGLPGIQTGGYANDGTPDTRGMMEKTADAVTGDNVDDKTGKIVDHRVDFSDYDLDPPGYWDNRTDLPERRYDLDAPETRRDLPPDNRYHDTYLDPLGNGIPGIQTGGHAKDGTPDTRGITEKAS
ncbi:MAG: hypothetical protein QM758_10960 [Armatimonas sp.]